MRRWLPSAAIWLALWTSVVALSPAANVETASAAPISFAPAAPKPDAPTLQPDRPLAALGGATLPAPALAVPTLAQSPAAAEGSAAEAVKGGDAAVSRGEYDRLTASWQDDLQRSFEAPAQPATIGQTLGSVFDKARNYAFLFRLRRGMRPIQARLSAGEIDEKAALRQGQDALGALRESALRPLYAGTLMRAAEAHAGGGQALEASLLRQKRLIDSAHREFNEDWRRYKSVYGPAHFSDSGRDRALMNVVAMRLFAAFHGVDDPSTREAVNGIAFLHPVTDDMVDSGTMRPETVVKIGRRLRGIKDPVEHPYERLVFGLIDGIHERYPRHAHPMLDWLLNDLWRAQLESAAQKAAPGIDAANRSTIAKGGLSTSAFGYIALGGLTAKQHEFFFSAGALYQWMDDLADIALDLKEGIQTAWTASLSAPADLERRLGALIRLKNGLLSRNAALGSFREGAELAGFVQRGFYLQYLTAAASNVAWLGASPYRALARHLSVSPKHAARANRIFLKLFAEAERYDPSGFTMSLERFLLNGQSPARLAERIPN